MAKKIIIDPELCIGCGSCEAIAPDYFQLDDDGKAKAIKEYSDDEKDIIKEAINTCPAGAISIEEE